MRPLRSRAPLAAALLLAAVACDDDDHHARSEVFTWRGAVPAGGTVRVRDLNGSVRVARAPGAEVVVTATRRARGRHPEAVRVVFTPDAAGVTACALWGDGGTCTADAYRTSSRRRGWLHFLRMRSRAEVDFVVALPAGVRLDAETVNGRITVADANADVRVRTVNGSVTLAAAGAPIDAGTVNGSIRAQIGAVPSGAAVALHTTNGSVTALVPPTFAAAVDLRTTNGRVRTDLPLTGEEGARRHRQGTLGAGGGRLSLRTTNGSVSLLGLPAGATPVAADDMRAVGM